MNDRSNPLRNLSLRKRPRAKTIFVHRVNYTESRPGEDILAERDRRASAPARNLTGAICGDPPVGFSALDRRGE